MATRIELIVDDAPNAQVESCVRRVTGNIETLLRDFPNAVVRYSYEKVEVEIPVIKPQRKEVGDGNPILKASLEDILLFERTQTLLKRYPTLHTDTVAELCQNTVDDLLGIPGFGDQALLDVQLALAVHSLNLKGDFIHKKLEPGYSVRYLGGLSNECRKALQENDINQVSDLISQTPRSLSRLVEPFAMEVERYLKLFGMHLRPNGVG